MKELKAYICEYCEDKLTLTTDLEWLIEHELLCDKNPVNIKFPHSCVWCANYEYSHQSREYDGFHKRYYYLRRHKCTAENVKCTDRVCLSFKPKEGTWYDKTNLL